MLTLTLPTAPTPGSAQAAIPMPGAIDTPDGMLAVDAQQYPRLARQFRTALESVTGKPIRGLINTHCHLDHTSGNIVFADVPILTHEKTLAAMYAGLGSKTRRLMCSPNPRITPSTSLKERRIVRHSKIE